MKPQDALAAISAVRVLGFSLTMPFVGLALHEAYGVPLSSVSIYYVAVAVGGALGQLTGGAVSDRAGRVKVMLASAFSAAFLLALVAVFNSPVYIEALTAMQSVASGSFASSSSALIGDYFADHAELVRAYGRVRMGSNLGWAVGVAVGGLLYQLLGLRSLFAFTSLTQASTIPMIMGLPSAAPRGQAKPLERPSRPLLLYLAPTSLTFVIAGLMGYPLVQYLSGCKGLTTSLAGSLLAVNGALVVVLQDLIARAAARLRASIALSAGMAIYAVGYGVLPLASSYPLAAADVVLITLGEMVVMPVSSAVAARLSSPSSRGSHMGVFGLVTSISRSASSSIFAALLTVMSPRSAWVVEAAIALTSSLGYLVLLGA